MNAVTQKDKWTRWTEQEIDTLVSLFTEGMTAAEVSARLGRSISSVRDKKRYVMSVQPPRKNPKTKIDFFNVLTVESAYVLGLLVTDGCVYRNQVILCQSHASGLRRLKAVQKFVGGSIYPAGGTSKSHKCAHRLVLFGQELIRILRRCGVTERKTTNVSFPEVDDKVLPHFVRGLFDGDGCVHLNKPRGNGLPVLRAIFCSASFGFLSVLLERLQTVGLPKPSVGSKRNGAYQVVWSAVKGAELLDWLYRNSTPETRYERKYKKFVDYLALRSGVRKTKRGPIPAEREFSMLYVGSTS